MNRRSLIKSLFTIAVAPKVLSELNLNVPFVSNPIAEKSLVSGLQMLTPQFYKAFVEKYGSENCTWGLSTYDKIPMPNENKYFRFESKNTEPCQNT
jgi:hypothetical protein